MRKKSGVAWSASMLALLMLPVLQAVRASDSNASIPFVIEDIMITAQKREEVLQLVPIAVSVIQGKDLRSNRVRNLQDLSGSVPNLYLAESFVGDSMFIRGVGSGQNNLGFEQTVGQVLDGFSYSRSRFSRAAFLDVERVEVLKGPQGILLGKNTTAGAINVTSGKPTDEYQAWITSDYEFEADKGYSIEGVISGPLSDTFKGRLAIKHDDREGYLKNTETGRSDVEANDTQLRASLTWTPTYDVEALFQYQYGELDHSGNNVQYSNCNLDNGLTAALTVGTSEDCRLNYRRSGAAPINGQGNVEGKDTRMDIYSLTVNWELGAHTLTSLTGYASYDYLDLQDTDRTRHENGLAEFSEDYAQWSQELRITSPLGAALDYMAGFYFLDKKQETEYLIHLANFDTSRNILTDESGTTYAAFGQVTFEAGDHWDLTLGGRYTYEKKKAQGIQSPAELYSFIPKAGPVAAVSGLDLVHNVADDFSETNFSPMVSLRWRPSEDLMYYASVRRGFKAGGYDHLLVASQTDAVERFQFDSEQVTAYELGMKLTLLDGRMQVNGAIFHSQFDDLQLSGFINSTDFINAVTNAGAAISEGVEVDLHWLATERLTLRGALSYLDASYDDYQEAPCYTGQTVAEGCNGGRQDLSGEKLQLSSDWKGSLSAEYVWSLGDDFELTGFVQASYVSELPLQADLDPQLFQDDYVKLDARLTLASVRGSWNLSLIGRNLNNQLTANYGDDIPAQAGSYWKCVDAPRSIALQGTVRF